MPAEPVGERDDYLLGILNITNVKYTLLRKGNT